MAYFSSNTSETPATISAVPVSRIWVAMADLEPIICELERAVRVHAVVANDVLGAARDPDADLIIFGTEQVLAMVHTLKGKAYAALDLFNDRDDDEPVEADTGEEHEPPKAANDASSDARHAA